MDRAKLGTGQNWGRKEDRRGLHDVCACMSVKVLCVQAQLATCNKKRPAALMQLSCEAADLARDAINARHHDNGKMLEKALGLRHIEMDGWLTLSTPEFPNGDLVGASMAAMGIANIYFIKEDLDNAQVWYKRAEELCPADEHLQREVLQQNTKQLLRYREVRFLNRKVVVHGLVSKQEYNGRSGVVLSLFSAERWEVLLKKTSSQPAVHLLVLEKNLSVV